MKVGFIGTGRMGQTMVRRLLDAKHDVGVYNRTAEKAKPLADVGDRRQDLGAGARRAHALMHTPRSTPQGCANAWLGYAVAMALKAKGRYVEI
jgi:3-hydroxyisobutyrate dehydrogenase